MPDYRQAPQANGQLWSQRNQRRDLMLTDQHGRKYHTSIEIKTGEPCGLIGPQYQSPLPVPLMYLKRSPNAERPYDIVVDYTAWIRDIRAERHEWDLKARRLSRSKYGDAWDQTKPIPAEILELMGEAPQAVEPVLAARQGNKWILGFTKTPDVRLAKYFEPKITDPNYRFDEPDFRDTDDDLDLEEQVDPNATGGKRTKPKSQDAIRKAKYRDGLKGKPVTDDLEEAVA